jgi:aminoglycoside 6-adenylyltransferase
MLNGSRANPNAIPDFFQDFDIVYLVTELESFKQNPNWIDCFGERMILQCPDDFSSQVPRDSYVYLMQFTDGNRIDLTLRTTPFEPDSLSVLLLDKDNTIAPLSPASDYLPEAPTSQTFFLCCNEFWWVCPYVAKGLWRNEIIYAQHHLGILRSQTLQMLTWQIAIQTDFKQPLGKLGKHLPNYLLPQQHAWLLESYSNAEIKPMWQALFALTNNFRTAALEVAKHFLFEYPMQDDTRVTKHLEHVQTLARVDKESL